MDDLTPVTRTERLLDGEDLTPTNREEMFIKRIYDKTQEIPEPVNRKEYFLKKAGEAGGDVTVVPLSVSANGTYSEAGKAYSPVTVAVEPPEDSYQLKSITTPTSLATFNASAMPMPSLKVSVEAKQDLHGYDHPWVGGAGKNKLKFPYFNSSQTVSGVTFTIHDDGTVNINGTATDTISFVLANNVVLDSIGSGDYILNGSAQGGATDGSTYFLGFYAPGKSKYDFGSGTTINLSGSEDVSANVYIRINNGYTANNLVFKPMLRLSTETDPTFAPYSNICPISGWTGANITNKDDLDNPTTTNTYPISWQSTAGEVYGGELDVVNGTLTVTSGYIASYDGETLPSTWISDRDVYAEGTTPTTGAEVCYELANPIIINLTPTLIKSLNGQNNLSVDCGDVIEGEYFIALGGE